MMLKGKVGATTYYVAESRQLARQAMNNSNYGVNASRTDLQQARRVKWSNLVNFYSANKAWMKKAYEDLKPGVSIFNRFMQLNINGADIPLTKAQAQAKIWVADSYRVSQGSLIPLQIAQGENYNTVKFTGIRVADSDVTDGKFATLGKFSTVLVNSGLGFADGDAIAFIQFFGTTVAPGTEGVLPASYRYAEIVLDSSSTAQMPALVENLIADQGDLAFDPKDEAMIAFVAIHTRKSGGKLLVSTQDMFLTQNPDNAWTNSAQLSEAIKSYGESTTVPLAPGGSSGFGSGNDSSTGGGGGDGGGSLG